MKILPGVICPGHDDTGVAYMKVSYIQDKDTGGSSGDSPDNFNELNVWTEDSGDGPYLVFETRRWAIDCDKADEVVRVLNDFMRRFMSEEHVEK